MTGKISLDDIIIEKLIKNDDVSGFDCGDKDLNDFIQNDAISQMQAKMNVTYLCKYQNPQNHIIGFITISNDSIKINQSDKEKLEIKYSDYPAIKIGRLATHHHMKRKDVGSYMILWVIGFALNQCKKLGVRFISVDAYDEPHVKKFYKKNQFVELEKSKRGNIPMYTDIDSW